MALKLKSAAAAWTARDLARQLRELADLVRDGQMPQDVFDAFISATKTSRNSSEAALRAVSQLLEQAR